MADRQRRYLSKIVGFNFDILIATSQACDAANIWHHLRLYRYVYHIRASATSLNMPARTIRNENACFAKAHIRRYAFEIGRSTRLERKCPGRTSCWPKLGLPIRPFGAKLENLPFLERIGCEKAVQFTCSQHTAAMRA